MLIINLIMKEEFDGFNLNFNNVIAKLIKYKSNNKNNQKGKIDILFNYFILGNCEVKNRFAFINLNDCELYNSGYPNSKHDKFYYNIAKSNVGLIFSGGLYLESAINKNSNPALIKIDDKSINAHKNFNDEIHTYGSKIFMQINPALGRGDALNKFMGIFSYSPSFNKSFNNSKQTCVRATDSICNQLVDNISKLVKFSILSGYDGVLINGDELNILGEFSSSEFNRRVFGYYSKEYDLTLKFLNNIKKLKYETNIVYSFTVDNFLRIIYKNNRKNINSMRNIGAKAEFKTICEFLVMLVQNGVDGFVFRFGTYENGYLFNYNQFQQNDLFYEFYKTIKDYFISINLRNKFSTDVFIIYTDNFDNLNIPANYVKNNIIDFIDVTRKIYSDNEYLKNIKNENGFKPCLKCGYCNKIAKNNRIECAVNPELINNELIENNVKVKKIAVIGAGISGLMCSIYLAKRGYTVEIFEKNNSINKVGRLYEVFDFDENMKIFNNYLESSIKNFIKNNKIILNLSKKFSVSENINNYDSIIIATGFKEKILNLNGSVLRNVKSIYDVLENIKYIENANKITIYSNNELSLKLALYLLKLNKRVSIIIQDFQHLKVHVAEDRLSYYFYQFQELKANVYIDAKVKNINEDFVEIIANNKLLKLNTITVVMNMISNIKYSYEQKLLQIDSQLFIYEPELVSNNKIYCDIVEAGFNGELFMIGKALQIGELADDVKTAYFVAKNL